MTATYNRTDWASAFRNVGQELSDVPVKASSGCIPEALIGTLYRNGPGRLERGGQWVHHPFDGDGMVTALKFDRQGVSLTNRFVRTEGSLKKKQTRFYIEAYSAAKSQAGYLQTLLIYA